MKRAFGRAVGLLLAIAGTLCCAVTATAAPDIESKEYPPRDSAEAAEYRGNIVFQNYCVKCHGVNADGNGRAAKLYNPRPANLVTSDKNDLYKETIIRKGGAAMARSEFMPPWGEELTDEQIADVVAYLRSIAATRR